MGNLGKDFNAADVPPDDAFTVIPDGTKVKIVLNKSEIKDTKKMHDDGAPMGRYVSCEFIVIEGRYESRRVYENINFESRNPEPSAKEGLTKGEITTRSGERQLADLAQAVGVLTFRDTSALEGIPFWATLGVEDAKGDFPARNKVKKYIPASEGPDAPSSSKPATGATPAKVAPWAKKSA